MLSNLVEKLESTLVWFNSSISEPLWNVTIIALLGVGIFFTLSTAIVQLRLFPESLREMWFGRSGDGNALTPFQAFATGLASRVGVGNVGGVATAIAIGGSGAIFWMWVTALIGMATAFAESSLAQLYKIKNSNGSFRGGPAYYISQGLKAPWLAVCFAVVLIFTFGFAFNAVQANAIVSATNNAWNWTPEYVGYALVILSGCVIFGGAKSVGKFSARIVPMMALFYLIMSVIIICMNMHKIPSIISGIFHNAFQFDAMTGGVFGSIFSIAMMQGIKRGLFSNEAGMGSAPNAAASAEVKHPASQGLIQMLGVFVDTIVVCSCTAFIILLADPNQTTGLTNIPLTQKALETHVGEFGVHFLAFILLLFAFSSITGNYAYAESNVRYIKNHPSLIVAFRILVLFFVLLGAVNKQSVVWDFADNIMAVMALINLVAIIFLSPIVLILLRDYQTQLKQGIREPILDLNKLPQLKKYNINFDVWENN